MNHDQFYTKLFNYKKCDSPDASLLYFLSDFTTKTKEELDLNLTTEFLVGSTRKKKRRKKSRILSESKKIRKY